MLLIHMFYFPSENLMLDYLRDLKGKKGHISCFPFLYQASYVKEGHEAGLV